MFDTSFFSCLPYTTYPLFTRDPAPPPHFTVPLAIPLPLAHRVRMGHGKPGKSWNFIIPFSRRGKSWKLMVCHGK